jgi:hypothetical protein
MPHPVSSRGQRNTIWDMVKLGEVLKKELGARLRSGAGCGRRKARARLVSRASPVREDEGIRQHQRGDGTEDADATIDGGIALVIIWDRGMKLAQHKGLTVDTTVGVFFMAHKSSGSGALMNIRTLAASVFPERHRPVTRFPSRLEHDRITLDPPSTEDVGFQMPAAVLGTAVASTA